MNLLILDLSHTHAHTNNLSFSVAKLCSIYSASMVSKKDKTQENFIDY